MIYSVVWYPHFSPEDPEILASFPTEGEAEADIEARRDNWQGNLVITEND